jgi:hypothetical protein
MNHKITIFLFLALMSGTSCKLFRGGKHETPLTPVSAVPVVVNTVREDVKKASELASSNWSSLSGKGDLQLDMGGNDLNLNAGFRMKRDSVLWLSISPGMGITAARVLITRDSVKMVNYIEKYYSVYSISYLQEMLGAPVSLRELQNLMLGLPLFDTATYRYDSLDFQWKAGSGSWSNRLFFEGSSLVASSLLQEALSRSVVARYKGKIASRETDTLFMPENISVKAVSGNKESNVVYALQELSSAVVLQFPFNIPSSYERR